jgi:hypothetical protein
MVDERIVEFGRERLPGRPVPDDLAILLAAQWDGNDAPLQALEIEFLAPGQTLELVDHSYLREKDRANPDIMANVAAMDEVSRHIAYVGEGLNGAALGYWLHPDEPADRPAPVVRLDTEGQFDILDGTTFAEAVVGCWVHDDDEWFGRLADQFESLGVPMPVRRWADLVRPTVVVDPGTWHHRLFYAERGRRGLSATP